MSTIPPLVTELGNALSGGGGGGIVNNTLPCNRR